MGGGVVPWKLFRFDIGEGADNGQYELGRMNWVPG